MLQFVDHLATIYDWKNKTEQEIATLCGGFIADFERTHPGYKFKKFLFDLNDETGNMHLQFKYHLNRKVK